MSCTPSVSIIVPCRNEARHIRQFLDNVLAQDLAGMEWEVIIADGISDDGTREIIAEYSYPRICVSDNPEKIVSTGLNRAIRQAHGEFIVRMDIHTEYARDYVSRCVETLLATGADNAGGPARTKAEGYWANAIAAAYHSPFACGGARFHDVDYEGWVDTVTYGCWRKSTLETLGLFDEALVRNQDDELNLRTIRRGGRIWQTPSIISWYVPRGSLDALWRQYFQYGFWKVAVIRKHRLPASWRHLAPGTFVLANLLLALAASVAALLGGWDAAKWFLAVWAWLAALYPFACCAAALVTASKHGWYLLPILPLVFACYHCSYGTGFLMGLAYNPAGRNPSEAGRVFTQITR